MENSNSLDQSNSITQATRADIYVKRTRIQCASLANNDKDDDNELFEHPLIKDADEDEKFRLLTLKIRQCNKIFDFANPCSQLKGKEIKIAALAEIIEYIANGDDEHFEEFMYREIEAMVSRNLFREFHPAERHEYDFDDEEPTLEIAWPHIHLVYELLLRFLDSPRFNASVAKKHFDREFIVNLLKMFNSEDPRERDYLKTILHRMYGKFLVFRAFIRKEINHIFLSFIFEDVNCSGIGELLEILGSIINGFTVPLKAEHKRFLEKVLLPLYSSKHLQQYHSQLCYCICQFLNKDSSLGPTVITRMLKYWPKTSSMKEIVFINELYEVLPNIPFDDLKDVVVALFRKICISACSSHFQVSEAAIKFLREDHNLMIVAHYPDELHPVMLPFLHKISNEHWHGSIKTLSRIVARQILSETVGSINDIQITVEKAEKIARDRGERHEEIFKHLEQLVIADDPPPTCPCVPVATSDDVPQEHPI